MRLVVPEASSHAVFRERAWLTRLKRYYRAELERYLRFLVPPGQSVLEIGCQDGDVLAHLEPSRGVGLDASPSLVALAQRRHPHLSFHVLRPGPLPVEGPFDAIILRYVVQFMEDMQAEIERLRGLCHGGTRLVIITHNYLWAPVLALLERLGLKERSGPCAWLTLNDQENVLVLADFEVIRKEYRTLLPVWIPAVSWVVNHILGILPGLWKAGIHQWTVARPRAISRESRQSVSVIIPCRNERGTLDAIVQRTPVIGQHSELVFVEGHSTDGTLDALHAVKARWADRDIKVLVQDGEGKGDAVRKGMESAKGDIVVILDADLSVDPEVLPRFVDALVAGYCELAVGSRLVYPQEAGAMRFLNSIANKLLARAFSFVIGQPIRDTLCGTKAMWKADYDRLARHREFFGTLDPFGDYDLLFGAARLSLKIREIPVHYRARSYGTTNIRRWQHGTLLCRMVWKGFMRLKLQRITADGSPR